MDIKIDLLKNHPESIPILAKIWQEVLGKIWLPDVSFEQTVARFQTHLNEDILPFTLVALHEGLPVGMCSLRESDCVRAGLNPWLGSLVVDANYQNMGIGRQLINAIVKKAHIMGFKKLYLCTFDQILPKYYARLGWQRMGSDNFKGKDVEIMEINISSEMLLILAR